MKQLSSNRKAKRWLSKSIPLPLSKSRVFSNSNTELKPVIQQSKHKHTYQQLQKRSKVTRHLLLLWLIHTFPHLPINRFLWNLPQNHQTYIYTYIITKHFSQYSLCVCCFCYYLTAFKTRLFTKNLLSSAFLSQYYNQNSIPSTDSPIPVLAIIILLE